MPEPTRPSPSVGSLGNSRDGMVHLMMTRHPSGGSGLTLSVTHDGWRGAAMLDAAALVRLERLCGMALEVFAAGGQDIDLLRERFAANFGDDERIAALIGPPPTAVAEEPEAA